MIDFFEDHPNFTKILIALIILALSVGAAILITHTRNVIFSGNEQIFDTNWSYRWAIVEVGNGELIEGEVTAWRDFDESDMIQFTIDGVTYLTHSSKVLLCSREP